MRLHRFFVSEIIGDKKDITVTSSGLVNQIQNVFRLKVNDSIIIFDGSGYDYECNILNISKTNIVLKISKARESHYMPKNSIYLFVGVVKKDTFEWVVEKATELGVTNIIPIIAERSEKKSLNEDRLKKISIEASEQSGRGSIPVIEKIMKLEDAIVSLKNRSLNQSEIKKEIEIIAFHTEGKFFRDENINKNIATAIFIGPEGGWSSKEILMFHENNIDIFCLGNQILRSETAVIAALSRIMFEN